MGPPWGAFCQITLTSCFWCHIGLRVDRGWKFKLGGIVREFTFVQGRFIEEDVLVKSSQLSSFSEGSASWQNSLSPLISNGCQSSSCVNLQAHPVFDVLQRTATWSSFPSFSRSCSDNHVFYLLSFVTPKVTGKHWRQSRVDKVDRVALALYTPVICY